MVLKESSLLIASAVSVIVLALFSSFTLYLYSCYARPEALKPAVYEKEISDRMGNIYKIVNDLKAVANGWSPFFSVPDRSSIKTSLEIEEELKTNPVAQYFDTLSQKVSALSTPDAQAQGVSKKAKATGKDAIIEDINFLPRSTASASEPEAKTGEDGHTTADIKQVGLALSTAKIRAFVHRIQNLFNSPGLVGHLYIAEAKIEDWSKESLFSVTSESQNDNFSSYSPASPPNQKKNSFIYIRGSKLFDDEYIKNAVEPEEEELNAATVEFINPYKWLYLATKSEFYNVLEPNGKIVVLVYPPGDKASRRTIKYPKDVNLFPMESLPKWDIELYEADEQRALNHCKTMLTANYVDSVDKLHVETVRA